MHEYILAAASRLNKAVATLITIPFHCALVHKMSSRCGMHVFSGHAGAPARFSRCFGEASLNVRPEIHRRTGLVVRPNLDGRKMGAQRPLRKVPATNAQVSDRLGA